MDMWVLGEAWRDAGFRVRVVGGGECTWGAAIHCEASVGMYVGSVFITLGMIAYCIMFYVYILRGFHQVRLFYCVKGWECC
jgi:hypothetical protein